MKKLIHLTLLLIWSVTPVAIAGDKTPTMGEDGIYHYDWYHQSFLELADDVAEAQDEGKAVLVKFDQKGCIYCEKMALEVFSHPAIQDYLKEHYLVIQLDLFGNRDVTDIDGETLAESEMAKRWGVLFTPTMYFVTGKKQGTSLPEISDAMMPGAFGKISFLGLLKWVKEGGPDTDETFQKYLSRTMSELRSALKASQT